MHLSGQTRPFGRKAGAFVDNCANVVQGISDLARNSPGGECCSGSKVSGDSLKSLDRPHDRVAARIEAVQKQTVRQD